MKDTLKIATRPIGGNSTGEHLKPMWKLANVSNKETRITTKRYTKDGDKVPLLTC